MPISNRDLIGLALEVQHPHETEGYGGNGSRGRRMGHVAAAVATHEGNTFRGVSIDTGSGTGFCAETAAVAAMVTAREYHIAKVVAVWRNDQTGGVHVLPPCGRCREFLRQIDPRNIGTEVVLGLTETTALRELLPAHEWPAPISTVPMSD